MSDERTVQMVPDALIRPGVHGYRAFPVPARVPVFPAGVGRYRSP